MTGPAPDWGRAMEAAALEILGDPPTRYTNEWRYGNRGSLVVNVSGPRAGQWKCWETNAGGGVLDFIEYHLGLERQQAWQWLQARRLVDSETPTQRTSATPKPTPATVQPRPSMQTSTTKQRDEQQRLRKFARDLWAPSELIPRSPDHPARRWLANRHLWRPELSLPSSVRWIPATSPLFKGLHQGAGSIVVLMAPPTAWETAWPHPPELEAIHLVSIDEDGRPALDRPGDHTDRENNARPGLGKRFYGSTKGLVAFWGNAVLTESTAPVRVIEGLADGLALASRFEGPVIAGIGTPARLAKDTGFVVWLAVAPHGVVIHADADEPGQAAARALRRALQAAGGTKIRAVLPPEGTGKDSADIAQHTPLLPLSSSWASYAATLREMNPAWPDWEIARQADIATTGGHNDQQQSLRRSGPAPRR